MSSPLKTYRLYCFDAAHRTVTSDLIEAATDQQAIAIARSQDLGTKCEIWQGSRLVAQLEGERRQA